MVKLVQPLTASVGRQCASRSGVCMVQGCHDLAFRDVVSLPVSRSLPFPPFPLLVGSTVAVVCTPIAGCTGKANLTF